MTNEQINALVAEKVMGWRCRTISPADDYSVLCHVREKWDGGMCDAFGHALEDIWMSEKNDCSFLPTCCRYRPGDYSRAALAALGIKVTQP